MSESGREMTWREMDPRDAAQVMGPVFDEVENELDNLLTREFAMRLEVLFSSGARACREMAGDKAFMELVDRLAAVVKAHVGDYRIY
jgi:hypothetical protein